MEKPKTANEANDFENRTRSPLRCIALLSDVWLVELVKRQLNYVDCIILRRIAIIGSWGIEEKVFVFCVCLLQPREIVRELIVVVWRDRSEAFGDY